jgi:hypothetical protein
MRRRYGTSAWIGFNDAGRRMRKLKLLALSELSFQLRNSKKNNASEPEIVHSLGEIPRGRS